MHNKNKDWDNTSPSSRRNLMEWAKSNFKKRAKFCRYVNKVKKPWDIPCFNKQSRTVFQSNFLLLDFHIIINVFIIYKVLFKAHLFERRYSIYCLWAFQIRTNQLLWQQECIPRSITFSLIVLRISCHVGWFLLRSTEYL